MEVLGKGVGPLRAARIRRSNEQVVRVHRLEVGQEDRRTVEVVDRNLEEALNLVGVQIHGDDPVNAGRGEHVGDELGADGHTGSVFAVLTCEPEVGDDRDDALGGGPLGGVDEHQQLHQVVGRRERALHDDHLLSAHGLLDADPEFPVTEDGVLHVAQRFSIAHGDAGTEVL